MPAGSTIVIRAWHPLWAVAAFKTDLNEVPAGLYRSSHTLHFHRALTRQDSVLGSSRFARRY
jgi:hypothetical protein